VCDILDSLERLFRRQVPLLYKDLNSRVNEEVTKWFREHRDRLDAFNTSANVVMSVLRPEQQNDRVYGIDSESLELIVSRALKLSRQQFEELQRWKTSEILDLAGCVQRIMDKTKNGPTKSIVNGVMVEEIDQVLLQTAAFQPGSSGDVRDLAKTWTSRCSNEVENIGMLYKRLQGKEAKWLTRLILKNYAPVKFPDVLNMVAGQSYLPRCVSISVSIPTSTLAAARQVGTGTVRGTALANPLPTPPTSSPLASAQMYTDMTSAIHSSSPVVTAQDNGNHGPVRRLVVSHQKRSVVPDMYPTSSSRSVLGELSSNLPRASQENSPRKNSPVKEGSPFIISGHGICRLTIDTCILARCLFLISPCISGTPWLMDDLLPRHGARILTSLSSLSHPSIPRHCPQTGRRYRKVALVEPNRTDQTVAFMKKIHSLGLKRKGKKEWVEVYDWRLLECFTKVEQGTTVDYNPWRRCWIGAV
jgi:hypothetical protein